MNGNKKAREGSPTRARFNRLHKTLDKSFYASDVDLVLLDRAGVVAFLEFKVDKEPITFTEAVLFDALVALAPVYVVRATVGAREFLQLKRPQQRFWVQHWGGVVDIRPTPPLVQVETLFEGGWRELAQWEKELREQRKGEETNERR